MGGRDPTLPYPGAAEEGEDGDEVLWTDHSSHFPFPCAGWGEEVEEGGWEVGGVCF